ncbi:cell division protein [Bifidobacterium sp. 79T10]|nr:cell division protein [Bifidobacterium saguinibicoloris]MBW3080199.1 cell division protein [Bifidobacterium saguinibicoloris]
MNEDNEPVDVTEGGAAAPQGQAAAPEAVAEPPAPPAVPSDAVGEPPSQPETEAYAMPLSPIAHEAAPEPLFPDAATSQDPHAEGDDDGTPNVLKSPFPLPDLRADADAESDADASRDEFTTVYDIIDRLEARLEEAKGSIFFPGTVRVYRDEFAGDLDELKHMLPVQLERASALMREAERRLESAQTQSNAIVASAQSRAADRIKEAEEQAQFLAGQENVTALARQKARRILEDAQAKADHLTQGADDYSTKVMETLRAQLTKMGGDVDAGLNVLYERRKAAARDLPHLNDDDYPEAQ